MKKILYSWIFWASTGLLAQAQTPAVLSVDATAPGAAIQPTMWGIFFEDINLAADGGVYAELVKNRSFEFYAPMMGWKEQRAEGVKASVLVQNRGAQNPDNPRFIRVKVESGNFGLANEGFRGMGIKSGERYHFSALVRQSGSAPLHIGIELRKPDGTVIGKSEISPKGGDWHSEQIEFTATATEPKAQLYLWFSGKGALDLDMISLFPEHTWKDRPGGLRADLVQKLADLHPGFLRFPGGCIVEGRELATRYQWKKTIGDVNERKVIVNRWNTEFAHRPTPDYFQSFGLGFLEYFEMAEDIGAEPLPILNCGMACQFNSCEVVPLDELDPYIQDALDLIEFANGSTDTKWGAERAKLGHPAPFNLKIMGVGNEQWGEQYVERQKIFTKAIKDKYPAMTLVSSAGPFPDGELFDYLSGEMRGLKADLVDEHYYKNPEWFLENAGRYDRYDRSGPRIFAGEYAAQSVATVSPDNKNNWRCALAEAAFMTGLERNADLVHMASYAPLFAHVEGWQWTPNLIWFDNLNSYTTPNYYVQQLFSANKGTQVLPVSVNGTTAEGQDGLYVSSVWDDKTGEVVIKAVNAAFRPKTLSLEIKGMKQWNGAATLTILRSDDPNAVNSLDAPETVHPVQSSVPMKGPHPELTLEPSSVTLIRIKKQ